MSDPFVVEGYPSAPQLREFGLSLQSYDKVHEGRDAVLKYEKATRDKNGNRACWRWFLAYTAIAYGGAGIALALGAELNWWAVFWTWIILLYFLAGLGGPAVLSRANPDPLTPELLTKLSESDETKRAILRFEEAFVGQFQPIIDSHFETYLYRKRSVSPEFEAHLLVFEGLLWRLLPADSQMIGNKRLSLAYYLDYVAVRKSNLGLTASSGNKGSSSENTSGESVSDQSETRNPVRDESLCPQELKSPKQYESKATKTPQEAQRAALVPKLPQKPPPPPRPEVRFRTPRQVDWKALIESRMRTGATGEEIVVMIEREFLRRVEREDLASRVLHVARELGDGTGYDVRSFFEDGREKFLEVKTTRSGLNQPFFASQSELEFLNRHRDDSFVYRVCVLESETEGVQIQVYSAEEVLSADKAPTQFRIKMPEGEYVTIQDTYTTVSCPSCGQKNRVPIARLALAICGSCKTGLVDF